jgi:hypothetical protein
MHSSELEETELQCISNNWKEFWQCCVSYKDGKVKKVKVQLSLCSINYALCHQDTGEWRCRSMYSWPSHWIEGSSQLHALITGEIIPCTHWIAGRGGPQSPSRSCGEVKISRLSQQSNHSSSAIQPIAYHCTSWVIPAPATQRGYKKYLQQAKLRREKWCYNFQQEFCKRLKLLLVTPPGLTIWPRHKMPGSNAKSRFQCIHSACCNTTALQKGPLENVQRF